MNANAIKALLLGWIFFTYGWATEPLETTSQPLQESLKKTQSQSMLLGEEQKEQPLLVEGDKATLKQAVAVAIERNFRVKQAQERITQAESSTAEAQSDLQPQVDFIVTGTGKETKGFDTQQYGQLKGDVAVNYNLYSSGMHVETIERTKITKKEQEERLRGTKEEEIVKVIDAYLSVVYGRLSIEVNQNNYDKLLKILEIVKTKRELGAATAGDENSILASVSNAKTALINTESNYNNAKDYYEFLTGSKIEEMVPFETEFEIVLQPLEKLLAQIEKENVDLTIIEKQIEGKQKDVTVTKASNGPKVDLAISNSKRARQDYSIVPTDGHNRDFTAELIFSYNLYDGGKNEAKTAKLLSEISGLVYNLEYTKKDTRWNSQKLFNSVQTNSRTIDTLKVEIEASKKMAEAYWEKFRLSSQDLVTLLQAQRQVNSAELAKLTSEKTRLTDYFNLLMKQGKLVDYFGL